MYIRAYIPPDLPPCHRFPAPFAFVQAILSCSASLLFVKLAWMLLGDS